MYSSTMVDLHLFRAHRDHPVSLSSIQTHALTLSGFDAVASAGALLGAHDLVRGGEVHVLRVGDRQPRLRQLVRAAVLGQQRLQLVHGNLQGKRCLHCTAVNRIAVFMASSYMNTLSLSTFMRGNFQKCSITRRSNNREPHIFPSA